MQVLGIASCYHTIQYNNTYSRYFFTDLHYFIECIHSLSQQGDITCFPVFFSITKNYIQGVRVHIHGL